uniref:nuclear receptor-binding factor 2 isoform X2 n=1 Tax=Myxine glutinosa TaxID=7769 RepID=UPI00358F6499
MDSPLNLAHLQGRKAEKFLAGGKYDDAIACHKKAAEHLEEATKLTDTDQALLSLRLQRDSHVTQQRIVQEKWSRARRETRLRAELQRRQQKVVGKKGASASPDETVSACETKLPKQDTTEVVPHDGEQAQLMKPGNFFDREPDTLIYLLKGGEGGLQAPVSGTKTSKTPSVLLEEQEGRIAELLRMLRLVLAKNEHLHKENQQLKAENAHLRKSCLVRPSSRVSDGQANISSFTSAFGVGCSRYLDPDTHFVDGHEVWALTDSPGEAGVSWQQLPTVGHLSALKHPVVSFDQQDGIPPLTDLPELGDLPPLELPAERFDLQGLGMTEAECVVHEDEKNEA